MRSIETMCLLSVKEVAFVPDDPSSYSGFTDMMGFGEMTVQAEVDAEALDPGLLHDQRTYALVFENKSPCMRPGPSRFKRSRLLHHCSRSPRSRNYAMRVISRTKRHMGKLVHRTIITNARIREQDIDTFAPIITFELSFDPVLQVITDTRFI